MHLRSRLRSEAKWLSFTRPNIETLGIGDECEVLAFGAIFFWALEVYVKK